MGNAILQNVLKRQLPPAFLAQFPEGVQLAYVIIPEIPQLTEPLQDSVRASFASGLAVLWKALIGFAAAGLFASLFMKEIPMHVETDENWAAVEKKG